MFNSTPNSQPATPPPVGETSRIKSFMGRTPAIGILKSKFLTVLGNSNELLNGISSKVRQKPKIYLIYSKIKRKRKLRNYLLTENLL